MLGAGTVILALTTMAQSPAVSKAWIEYMPHPRDMVQVREGVPFIVPANRLFVLTGLGSTNFDYGSYVQLNVNGAQQASALGVQGNYQGGSSIQPIPAGLTIPAGSSIDVTDGLAGGRAIAIGYLAGP